MEILSNRILNMAESETLAMTAKARELKAQGKDVISLSIGEPDFNTPEAVKEAAKKAIDDNFTHYPPVPGYPDLREAICTKLRRDNGLEYKPEQIVVSTGAKQSLFQVVQCLINPGDEVLVPNPGYPTYTALNKILGTRIVNYTLREDNGWQPDFDALEQMDLMRVKVMWTNYPNMPTGGVARRETFERLVRFAQEHSIVVINDNPYSLILNDHPLSLMQVDGAKDCCVELNSMSKSFNMPGWRMAMVVSNPTYISWILKIKSNVDNGCFRGIQLAAAEAFNTNTPEWHHEFNVEVYRRRRVIAEEIMKSLNCTFDPNQTGMFLWGRIPDRYIDVEELTERLLHEARVFITPGFIFGRNGRRYIRISLCAKDEKMKEALRRINAMMASN